LAVYVVLGRNSQPDGVETRDTFAAFGLYGFVLVPLTYIATRIWTIRHPGPVVATGDGSSINSEMGLVLALSAVSFTVFIIGHIMTSMQITSLEGRLERLQNSMDKVA
jgi:ABC-type transport system involved in cytochrome c biogenesis permease subunit